MKDLHLLVWLTQLGMSVAAPLAGFTLLSAWLREKFELGAWVVLCGCALGLISAADGLRYSLKAMNAFNKGRAKKAEKQEPIATAFNDHE